jgi:CRISPR-associated protein Cmr6
MQQGTLKVKIKSSGHRKKADIVADKKYTIPKEFSLTNELNEIECTFELNEQNQVTKIIVNGEELKKRDKVKKIQKCKDKNYFVPNDTCLEIESKSLKIDEIENFHLRLNKFVKIDFNEEKDKYEFDFESVKKHLPKLQQVEDYYKSIDKYLTDKKSFDLTIENRLIIGLGSTSVFDTSMTLHHIYGIPYIPSTTIKGSFRSCIIQRYFNGNEKKALKRDWFVNIFGSQDQEGKVIFFDSFSEDVKIQKDIMTPHYKEYYSDKDNKKKIAPTDTQDPNPIPFLVVTGEFKFLIAVKENIQLKIKYKKFSILEFVENGLKKSLQNHGIGGKTAVGYGYFNEEKKL